MRFLLYLLWSVVSILVIVLVAVTLLLTMFHEQVEDRLVHSIEQATGRDIRIEGGFGFRFNPRPTFIAKDIKMANADWAGRPWMLEVDALEVSFSPGGLFAGDANLYSVKGTRPSVLVEQNPLTGKINWQFEFKHKPRPLAWLAEHLKIQSAQIVDASVEIKVGSIDHFLEFDVINGQTDYFSKLVDIQALGTLDKRSLELNIEMDNLRNMFLRDPTIIRFDGLHGVTKISGQGEIADLLRWQGHRIKLALSVPSLLEVQGWVSTRLIDTPELEATALFVQPHKWDSARLEDVQVKSDAIDGSTRINGRINKLRGLYGIDLEGVLHYPLSSIIKWKGLASDTDTELDADLTLKGNRAEALAFNVVSASLKGQGVDIHGQGGIAHLLQSSTEGIPFEGSASSLSRIGAINAKHWVETDALKGQFELRKKNGRLALEKIKVAAFEGRVNIHGELQDITRQQIGQYSLESDLLREDVERINSLNGLNFPAFKQSKISAQISMRRNKFSAQEVALNLISRGLSVEGTGNIEDIQSLSIQAADLTIEAQSIEDINTQFATKFPEIGRLQGSGKFSGNITNHYNINTINAVSNSKYQDINASGSLSNLGAEMTGRLSLKGVIRSFRNIPPMLGSDMSVPGDVQAGGSAILMAHRANDWSVQDINIDFDGQNQGSIKGKIEHFPNAGSYALLADFRRVAPRDLPAFDLFKTLKPENINLFTQINKKSTDENFSLAEIDASFNLAEGGATVNIGGEINDINHFKELDLRIGIRTPDMVSVPYLASLPLKKDLDLNASIELKGSPESLNMNLLGINIDENEIHGNLIFTNKTAGKPMLKGRLGSKNLDMLSIMYQVERKRLFSNEPLQFDWLNSLNARINFTAQHLNGVVSQLDNVSGKIVVQDGIFNLPNMHGSVGDGGSMAAWTTIVVKQKPYSIVVSLKGVNLEPSNLNLFGDSGFIRDGRIDIDIGLGGSGVSIADFMGRSYGKIQLQMHDSLIKHRNLKLFGADLVSGVFDIIDTISKNDIYLPIECGVIHFPVVNGKAVASQGIAIKTDKITILGGGIIDLGSEELELIIQPKARKGLGINAGTVANVVKISGTINQPKIGVAQSGVIQTSATIGVAIASGGWSLLVQGLLDRNKANSDVCNQTMREPNTPYFKSSDSALDYEGGQR